MTEAAIDWEKLEREVDKPEHFPVLTRREKQLYLLRFSTDPPMSTGDLAEKLGMQRNTVAKLWQRVRDKTGLPTLEPAAVHQRAISTGRVPQGEYLARIDQNARAALERMEALIPNSGSLKDVSVVFRDLMNVRALILGEPTSIIGTNNRQTVNEVVEMLVREAKRRGIHIGTESSSGNVVLESMTKVIEAQARREP